MRRRRDIRFARCVIHIGCEKTGSSSIQRFLSMNRPFWRKEGILYPVAGGSLYGGSQWNFAALAKERAWEGDLGARAGIPDAESQRALASTVEAAIRSEVRSVRSPTTLVISSEHLHSRLTTTAEIETLRAFLSPFADAFEVVVYFRRQDRVAASLFATHVKSGNPAPAPFLPASHAGPDFYYFDALHIYQNWASVFGADAMRPRLFERALARGGLLRDFCEAAALPFEGKRLPEKENVSLDPAATRFLIHLNRLAQDQPDFAFDRDEIIRTLERIRPGRMIPFTRQTARAFYERFTESNEALRLLAFPGKRAPLFDEDFSGYPETPPAVEKPLLELLRVAVELWSAARS